MRLARMDRYVLAKLLAEFAQGRLLPPEDVTMLIQDGTTRQQLLERPALVMALVAQATAASGLDCDEVAAQLAAYVDGEDEGNDLAAHYQPLREHLQSCPLCYEDYQLVRTILAAQQTGAVPRWPLQAHAGIVLRRADLLRSVQVCDRTAGATTQLYAGVVPDLPALAAQIALLRQAPEPQADWQLTVTLTGATVAGLRVMLRYETELRIQHTDGWGYACFPDVPSSWLLNETGADLLVLFVAPDP